MRLPAFALLLSLAASAALLAGCGAPAKSLQMVQPPAEVLQLRGFMPEALRGQVALAPVRGGAETGRWWGSKVSNTALAHALEDTLRELGLWATDPAQARYQLRAELLQLSQPWVSLDTTVEASVRYALVDLSSGAILYERSVRTAYKAEFLDAMLSQPERLQLASEGAMRQAMGIMLRDLPNLRL
jgi:hypothetical protein